MKKTTQYVYFLIAYYQYYINFQLLAFENGKILICGNKKKYAW